MVNKRTIICAGLAGALGLVVFLAIKGFSVDQAKQRLDRFSIEGIRSSSPSDSRWAVHCDTDLESVLAQKFSYLAEGGQCYAFLSEDRRYVLKFLKQKKFSQTRFKNYDKRLRRKKKNFISYKIAYDYLREETGLLFIHLVPGDGFSKQITLVDALKRPYQIELGEFEFLLQKFADPITSSLTKAMNAHCEEEAKEVIDRVFTLIYHRLDKGIADRDPAIAGNLGVIEERIVQLDIGRFFMVQQPEQWSIELNEFLKKNRFFGAWLQDNYPSLLPYYQNKKAELENHYRKKMLTPACNTEP